MFFGVKSSTPMLMVINGTLRHLDVQVDDDDDFVNPYTDDREHHSMKNSSSGEHKPTNVTNCIHLIQIGLRRMM